MKKSEKIRITGWIIYILVLIIMLALILFIHRVWLIIATLAMFALGYICMCIIHSLTTHYVCPKCHTVFKVNVFQDLFSLSGGKCGKKVSCPSCKTRTYMIDETD